MPWRFLPPSTNAQARSSRFACLEDSPSRRLPSSSVCPWLRSKTICALPERGSATSWELTMTPSPNSTLRNGHLPVPPSAGESFPEPGRQLYVLFVAALRLSPAERHAFLEQECRDNPALRAQVENLLRHDAAAEKEGFLAEAL